MPDDLPPSADLFGREVRNAGGENLGRIEMIVRLPNGERQAVVRRGRLWRRRYFVSLAGALLLNGRVVVSVQPVPVVPLPSEENPNRAA